jgi:hypothetical protein
VHFLVIKDGMTDEFPLARAATMAEMADFLRVTAAISRPSAAQTVCVIADRQSAPALSAIHREKLRIRLSLITLQE